MQKSSSAKYTSKGLGPGEFMVEGWLSTSTSSEKRHWDLKTLFRGSWISASVPSNFSIPTYIFSPHLFWQILFINEILNDLSFNYLIYKHVFSREQGLEDDNRANIDLQKKTKIATVDDSSQFHISSHSAIQ